MVSYFLLSLFSLGCDNHGHKKVTQTVFIYGVTKTTTGEIQCMLQVVLEATGEDQLHNIARNLEEAGISYKLWIEQPENFPTALASAPARKSTVAPFFKKLKLCKG